MEGLLAAAGRGPAQGVLGAPEDRPASRVTCILGGGRILLSGPLSPPRLSPLSPSALTSSYKETHHWIEGPPSSSLIWRDGGVRVEYLGVPSWGVGNTDFKAAVGGGTRRSSRWERSALPAAQPARRLVERWSWWGRTQQGWFSLPATDASARPDGTILPGSNWPCGQRPMSALLLLEGPEVCSCGDGGMSTCDFAGSRLAPYPRTRVSESCPMVSAPRPTLSLGGEREAHGRAPSGHTWEPLASGPAGQ